MEELEALAALLKERNAIDARIAALIGRPALSGHIGEFIASKVFGIRLCDSATTQSIDGHFMGGPLDGKSVNVKWYGKRESILDLNPINPPDYYLVLTGPAAPPVSSRGGTRPAVIEAVYLFEAARLIAELRSRGVKIGIASSVRAATWAKSEIYPEANPVFPVSPEHRAALRSFASM